MLWQLFRIATPLRDAYPLSILVASGMEDGPEGDEVLRASSAAQTPLARAF